MVSYSYSSVLMCQSHFFSVAHISFSSSTEDALEYAYTYVRYHVTMSNTSLLVKIIVYSGAEDLRLLLPFFFFFFFFIFFFWGGGVVVWKFYYKIKRFKIIFI